MNELGKNLRSRRKALGLSLKLLANVIGTTPSYLSMVENGKIDPSISNLKKIATGLNTTIVELFQDQRSEDFVVRKEQRTSADFKGCRMEGLVPQVPTREIDARLVLIQAGSSTEGLYSHPGEEFGLVLKGSLELTVNGVTRELQEGDSFYFSSEKPHAAQNKGDEDALVVWVNHPPSW